MKLRAVLGISAVSIALAACGSSDAPTGSNADGASETSTTSPSNGSAAEALEKLGDKQVVVQNQGGAQAGSNLSLPDGFPDDVSLPTDMNVVSTSTPLPDTQMIMGITPSTPASVIEAFRANMSDNGWTESGFQEMTPQMTRIDFEKGERMANVTVTLNGDTSAVQLMTGPKLGN